jgi:two-component system, chemotaxis family, response regulator Rcp1
MSRHWEGNPGRILLIEDNDADARIFAEAIRETGIASDFTVLRSGTEAKEFLYRQGRFAGVALPDLILLDLNMPGKDGREILAEIKGAPDLVRIPVIILSTSAAPQDVLDSYHLHANCYIVKPPSYDRILEVIRKIGDFWFGVVKLPFRT